MADGCCRLATLLDLEMLHRKRVRIYSYDVGWPSMRRLDGKEVAEQLGGRHLLYFLPRDRSGSLLGGTDRPKYLTPTPYPPTDEMIAWLGLPFVDVKRELALLLDPAKLTGVYGPRDVKLGDGIEYVLPGGFPADAIVEMSADPSDVPARWELLIT